MNKIDKILENAYKDIDIPKSKILEYKKLANDFINELKNFGIEAKVGGSLAKGTLIKTSEKADIDIFTVFEYSEDIKKLEKVLKKIKRFGKVKKIHGSRDYFQIENSIAILEIIPVVKNLDPSLAENVTDVSLRHVRYVRNAILKNKDLAREIKLAKAWMRANKIYGAESYVKGFSGYSLEVLTIYFKSFFKMLKGLQKLKVIDPHKYYKSENEIRREINSSKLISPIILIDPTNKHRNASAGLGIESYNKFLKKSKEFLKNPNILNFKEQKINIEEMKKEAKMKKAKYIEINLSTFRQGGDIAGTKMKKFFDFLISELKRKGQNVLRSEFEYDGISKNAKGYLIVKEKNEIIVKGPSKGLEEAALKFRKHRRKSAFLKGKEWYAKEKTSIKKILEHCKKHESDMGVKISY